MIILGDSAYPLATYPTTWNGLAVGGWGFYIGGNTPHTWSAAEVAALKTHYRYLLPIYTCSNPGSRNAAADAADAIAHLRALDIPVGTEVQLDYETAVDSAYEQAFDKALRVAGYSLILYGSASTVVKNARPSAGYNEAGWTGKAYAPADAADQFVDTGAFDLNEFATDASLWDTRPPAPIQAAPAAATEEDDMQQIEPTRDHPGEYAYGVTAGKTKVAFVADGYALAPAKLRVATWVGNNPQVHEGVTLGGTASEHYATVALPPGCNAVTVRREDSSAFPVGVYLI